MYFDIKQLLADREKDGSKGLYIPGVNALDNSSHCYYEWLLINLEKKVRTIKRKREISPYILIEDWGKKKSHVHYIRNKGLLLTHLNLVKRKWNVYLHVYKYDVNKFDRTCIFVFCT